MNLFDTIRHRRSVRTFDGRALLPEDARKIAEFADGVENPYGLPITWRLLDAKRHGLNAPVISGAETYIAGKLRRAEHAEEAFGYAFERIVLFAEAMGIGSTWIAGTMNRPAFESAMELTAEEVMPCVSPLGYPAKKMALREAMMRKGVRADSRLAFDALFFDGAFTAPLSPEKAGKLQTALEMVRLAPSAVNRQPWRVVLCGDTAHFYEKRSKGFLGDDGWDIQKIDVGIALCHFELAAKECGYSAAFRIDDPRLPAADDLFYVASYTLDAADK